MPAYSIERLREITDELDEFNSHPLSEITLTEGGKPIEIPEEAIEGWKFIGLSNCSFFLAEAWKNPDVLSISTDPV